MYKFILNLEIGLLIGSNCFVVLEFLEVVFRGDEGFYVMWLCYGWILIGFLYVKDILNFSNVMCYRIMVWEVEIVKEMVLF